MREVGADWRHAVLVCCNQRPPGAEKSSCGEARGAALRDWLKARAKADGVKDRLLTARTSCLGVCSPLGVTVAAVPDPTTTQPRRMWVVADDDDRDALWAAIRRHLGV